MCSDVDGLILPFKVVSHMTVLGEHLDNQGCTLASVTYRQTKAENNFWSSSDAFLAPAPVSEKIAAWCRGPRTSVLFGSTNWHLTDEVLHTLWTWELRWLRKCLRMKRRPAESQAEYFICTSLRIKEWLAQFGLKTICVQLLTQIFRAAFRENHNSTSGAQQLRDLRAYRSRIRWEVVKHCSAKRRKLKGYLQRFQGPRPYWEDVFVNFMGLDWQMKCSSMSWKDWNSQLPAFLKHCCERWNLPLGDASDIGDGLREPRTKRPRYTQDESSKHRLCFRGSMPEADEVLDSVARHISWICSGRSFVYVTD